jgi:radical SAM protein (TIGR01212 family)
MPPMRAHAVGAWGYRSYREHLAERFPGMRVRKLCLHAGFTCPNLDGSRGRGGCAYCDNHAFAPGLERTRDLARQWEEGRAWLRRRHRRADGFIAYFQSFSNTYAAPQALAALYDPVPEWDECVGISLGTRPDCLPPPVLDYLAALARRTFLTVEIGLQSDRDAVLTRLNRGHDVACFQDAVQRAAGRGFELCAHLMLGLPGEGADAPERLGDLMASLPLRSVKLHNLHIVRGTALARAYAEGALAEPTRADHLDGARRFLARLRPDQAVQRIVADAPRALLLGAPWCRDKQAFLADLGAALRPEGAPSGSAVSGSAPPGSARLQPGSPVRAGGGVTMKNAVGSVPAGG